MSLCISVSVMNFSVEAHQTITSRSQPLASLKRRICSRKSSTARVMDGAVLTFVPLMRLTYSLSNTAGMGSIDFRNGAMGSI